MSTERIIISENEDDTENLAAGIAAGLSPGSVVLLRGDLGAGKTVFARGFARGLGIVEPVSSPTYTIAQEYPLPNGGRLCHLDLYRINGAEAALAFGVDEYLDDPGSFVLIEWPERIESLLPATAITVNIVHRGEHTREITVTS